MVRVTYIGLIEPVRAFEDLRPYFDRLVEMKGRCKPFGRDYYALSIPIDALNTAAYHFTRRPHFYQLGDPLGHRS